MPRSFRQALRAFDAEQNRTEAFIARQEAALLDIFDQAERRLYAQRNLLLPALSLDTTTGRLASHADDLANVESLIAQIREELRPALIDPGREWAEEAIVGAHRQGRRLAHTSMDHTLTDPELIGQAFAHVTPTERAILQVGLEDGYRIMNTVGDDVAEWFRREITDAMLAGRPVQGPGSLAERLYASGRLRPQTIRTQSGKLITRSVRQRAIAIARIETSKVVERTSIQKAVDVYGENPLFINRNPEDDRSTDICVKASNAGPMTLEEWDRSPFGRPPRLKPFHLCRSSLLVVPSRADLEAVGHPQAKAA